MNDFVPFSYFKLVYEIQYKTPAGLKQTFRKFLKFDVMKPLDITTKIYIVEIDQIYLEAQTQNITNSPTCLKRVELDSSGYYISTSLNTLDNGESVFNSKNMLYIRNSCQFLYCIKSTTKELLHVDRI